MRAYAGIGSRETPEEVCGFMRDVADHLACDGWTLRSGNAPGADQAFALGHLAAISGIEPELYVPWRDFEAWFLKGWLVEPRMPQDEAYEIAAEFHPAWDRLTRGARSMHARNVHQILGPDVLSYELSKFVVCWTKGAKGCGGTGQALRVARSYGVPIFDLASPDARGRLERWLRKDVAA